jgi:ADP-heptose:LPS heptosyltransferase
MSKASLVIIKSMGIGDLVILIANIHAISKSIDEPVTVLAQKSTQATEILKHDPFVKEVIDLEKKGFFNIIKKIKSSNFQQSFIYSDSIRLYLIAKLAGIKNNFHYKFFSKKGKNFFRTAKDFTEKVLSIKVNTESKIFIDDSAVLGSIKKFNILKEEKNIVCGISASGPTKRWDIENYIKLFESINRNFPCKFFLAGGYYDKDLIKQVMDSSIGKKCISFENLKISETIPIIKACNFCISNDTGFAHISSSLGLKTLILFMDSPPVAYGAYNKNISIIIPSGETIESCGHNTRGKNKILFEDVLEKMTDFLG